MKKQRFGELKWQNLNPGLSQSHACPLHRGLGRGMSVDVLRVIIAVILMSPNISLNVNSTSTTWAHLMYWHRMSERWREVFRNRGPGKITFLQSCDMDWAPSPVPGTGDPSYIRPSLWEAQRASHLLARQMGVLWEDPARVLLEEPILWSMERTIEHVHLNCSF